MAIMSCCDELIELFLEDAPRLVGDLHERHPGRGDAKGVGPAGGPMRCVARSVTSSAAVACDAASRLERMGQNGHLTRAAETYTILVEAVEQLQHALGKLVRRSRRSECKPAVDGFPQSVQVSRAD